MQNVNDVNDILQVIAREGKKSIVLYKINSQNMRDIVDIKKYKGKYFLDCIKGLVYSTDSYTIYYWYNKLFYDFDVHIDTYLHKFKKELDSPKHITDNTLEEAVKHEISYYENGYIYKSEWFKIRGKQIKKGRWIKEPLKARLIFESIKNYHKELFLNE